MLAFFARLLLLSLGPSFLLCGVLVALLLVFGLLCADQLHLGLFLVLFMGLSILAMLCLPLFVLLLIVSSSSRFPEPSTPFYPGLDLDLQPDGVWWDPLPGGSWYLSFVAQRGGQGSFLAQVGLAAADSWKNGPVFSDSGLEIPVFVWSDEVWITGVTGFLLLSAMWELESVWVLP